MEFIKKIIDGLKDPKKRSLTLLAIYALFFTFVFILIQNKTVKPQSEIDTQKNDTITSYNYSYKITENDNITEVYGIHDDLKVTFNYNGIDYYYDGKLYTIENENKIYHDEINTNVEPYSYSTIEELIKNSEFIEKTTYKDNKEKTVYNIQAQKYFDLMNKQNNCELLDCINTYISITVESLDYINNVIIDLNEYSNYKVEINYSNVK